MLEGKLESVPDDDLERVYKRAVGSIVAAAAEGRAKAHCTVRLAPRCVRPLCARRASHPLGKAVAGWSHSMKSTRAVYRKLPELCRTRTARPSPEPRHAPLVRRPLY